MSCLSENTRVCKKCLEEKSIDYFLMKDKKTNRRSGFCKACEYARKKIYNENNKDKIKIKNEKYYSENKDKLIANSEIYRKKNPQKTKKARHESYIKNKYKHEVKRSEYGKSKRKETNKREAEKRKNNPNIKLRLYISSKIRGMIKKSGGKKNGTSVTKYVPYTFEKLKLHLESLFEPWMNWNNHGKLDPKNWNDNDQSTWTWQLDHIIPQSKLPYTSMEDEDFKKCWALENLRPYPAKANLLEGNRR